MNNHPSPSYVINFDDAKITDDDGQMSGSHDATTRCICLSYFRSANMMQPLDVQKTIRLSCLLSRYANITV